MSTAMLIIFGITAFIMIVTYAVSGVLYAEEEEYDYMEQYEDYLPDYETVMTFEQWINFYYDIARDKVLEGKQFEFFSEEGTTPFLLTHQELITNRVSIDYNYFTGHDLFNLYPTGFKWWSHSHYLDATWLTNRRNQIKEDFYRDYLHELGYDFEDTEEGITLTVYQRGFLEIATEFLGSLPQGFGRMVDLVTFNHIPHTEGTLKEVLQVIFIPLWIILMIGIAPIVAKFINAIGNLIPTT